MGIKDMFNRKNSNSETKKNKDSTNEDTQDLMEVDYKKKNLNKNQYYVTVKEAFGNTARTVKSFPVQRYVDQDDFITYLYNEKQNFLEVMPQKKHQEINYTKKQVEEKLKKLRQQLEDQSNEKKKDPNINSKDIKKRIREFEAINRNLNYSSDSTFTDQLEDGTPHFIFLREGSSFIPLKWDLDTSTIHTANDAKKKTANIVLRNKASKYPKAEKKVHIASWMFLLITLVAAFGSGFLFYKMQQQYSQDQITQMRAQILEDTAKQSENVKKASDGLSKIIASLEDDIVLDTQPEAINNDSSSSLNVTG